MRRKDQGPSPHLFHALTVLCLALLPWPAASQEAIKMSYEAAEKSFQRGEYDQAQSAFQAVLVETYHARAALYRQQGFWERAKDDLQAAFDLRPDSKGLRYDLAYAYFRAGALHLKLNRPREAVQALRQSLALAGKVGPAPFEVYRAHYLLSQAYRTLGDLKSSAQEARAAQPASSESAGRERRVARSDGLQGTLGELPEVEQTIAGEGLSLPAALTSEQQRWLVVYGEVLAGGQNFLGLIAARQQRFTEAVHHLAIARDLQPHLPGVDFNLGLALFNAEKYSEALPAFEKAVTRAPSNLAAKKYLGLAYSQEGQCEKAAKLLTEVLPSYPDDAQVLLALGAALARTRRGDEAQRVFEKLLKAHPDSAPLHVLWGQAYAAQGQADAAERELQQALTLDPRVASAHFDLGRIFLERGRLNDAEREFSAELAGQPKDLRSRYDLAFVLLKQQRLDQGIGLLRQLIQEKPDYAQAHYSLGQALLQRGLVPEAIEHLEAAVRLDPEKAYSHYQLGRAYLEAGRRDEAEKEFQLAMKLKDRQQSMSRSALPGQ